MKFEELDLSDNVLDSLYDMNFEDCTPVQENCIPEILKGRDLMGVAQTGTGKTAAYLLPILSKLDEGSYPKDAVNCIIMSPTRELAQQIDQAMQGFSYYLPEVSSVAVYGGNDGNRYDQEMKSMRLGADVIIATPGRLISHISMGNIDLSRVSFFVLDEADRMLDMGFSDDIMKIASFLPETCQTIMYSATMPKDIEKMAQKLLKDPVEIKLAVSKPAEKIQQSAYVCYTTQKLQIIKHLFKTGDLQRVIIFSGSKMKVKQINAALSQMKINSGEMHSDLDQAQRDDIMFRFKSGQIDVLVATDIVARGIDIDDIAMVINYDVPRDTEDYVHRIGRTARAERDGRAITLVNEEDMYAFRQIEKFLEKDIDKNPLPESVGEGPEYVKNPKRSSAKSRRQKDREETSHKNKKSRSRGGRNDQRREKQPKATDAAATEGTASDSATVETNATAGSEAVAPTADTTENQLSGEGKKKRRRSRGRGRKGEVGNSDNSIASTSETSVADASSADALDSQQPSEGKNKRRRNRGGNRELNRESQGQNNNDQRRDTAERNGQRERGEKRGEKRNEKRSDKRSENNGGENKNNGDRRGRKNRQNRDRQNAPSQKSSRQSKPEQKQEGGITEIIKRPLKWLKSLTGK